LKPVISEDFSAFNSAQWVIGGNAFWNQAAGNFVLTPALGSQRGRLYFATPFRISRFRAEFDYNISGGTGADGLTFAFVPNPNYPSSAGGLLDFCNTSGFAVEFDTFINEWDPPGRHIGVIRDCATNHLVSVLQETRGSHHVLIDFDNGNVKVTFDGVPVIDFTIPSFVPFDGFFGFTAATGALTDNHVIDNFTLSLPSGGITGLVTAGTGAVLQGAVVDAFSAGTGAFVAAAFTDANGNYALQHLAPGTYKVKAHFNGLVDVFYATGGLSGIDLTTATPVLLTDTIVGNINIALPPGGAISGFVHARGTSTPLVGVPVFISRFLSNTYLFRNPSLVFTDNNGFFMFQGLRDGDWLVRVEPQSQGYTISYYSGDADNPATDNGTATPKSVVSPQHSAEDS